jgi:hypothetical protein
MDSTLTRFARLAAVLATLAAGHAAAANHELTVSPIPLGRFTVACSNIAQDMSLIASGATASDYWEGRPTNGQAHYVTDILAAPQSAFQFDVPVPDVRRLYVGHAGDNVRYVALVCYPTPSSNSDPDYALPQTGDTIPHMQPAGAPPRLISLVDYYAAFGQNVFAPLGAPMPLPLVVYSHGLGGSPISSGYVQSMVQLAAQGYMVAGVFHGDPRFSTIRVQDLSQLVNVALNFDRLVEMIMIRPLSLKVMLDKLLADPNYGNSIDTTRIAGFGASLGGTAMVGLAGGKFTTSLDGSSCDEPQHDPRIKAIFGYVPYAGQHFLPQFCNGQSGASAVKVPFFAMSGTADTTAPLDVMEQALNNFQGSHFMSELIDGQHELRPEDAGILFTWMITYYDAYLGIPFDPTAMARFIRMDQVASSAGRENHVIVDVHVPFANASGEATALEFYNTYLGHYFMAAGQDEIAAIEAGAAGPGWQLTGQSFKVWPLMPTDAAFSAATPVCRFYGVPAGGPNSHFFTASPSECALVKASQGWYYEGIGFYILQVDANGQCPAGYLEVLRAYNNGAARNDSNHRFTTSDSTWRAMGRLGWAMEGAVMCARP